MGGLSALRHLFDLLVTRARLAGDRPSGAGEKRKKGKKKRRKKNKIKKKKS